MEFPFAECIGGANLTTLCIRYARVLLNQLASYAGSKPVTRLTASLLCRLLALVKSQGIIVLQLLYPNFSSSVWWACLRDRLPVRFIAQTEKASFCCQSICVFGKFPVSLYMLNTIFARASIGIVLFCESVLGVSTAGG